jgi:hypothetical protein
MHVHRVGKPRRPSSAFQHREQGCAGRWRLLSGWASLTLGTNIAASSGAYTRSARLVGDRVFLRGALINNGGSTSATLATIPSGMSPTATVAQPGVCGLSGPRT